MKLKLNFSGAVVEVESRIYELAQKQDKGQADTPAGSLEIMESRGTGNAWRTASLLGTLLRKKILTVEEVNDIAGIDVMHEAIIYDATDDDRPIPF